MSAITYIAIFIGGALGVWGLAVSVRRLGSNVVGGVSAVRTSYRTALKGAYRTAETIAIASGLLVFCFFAGLLVYDAVYYTEPSQFLRVVRLLGSLRTAMFQFAGLLRALWS